VSATVSRPLLRWSSTRDCPRKAIYEATGAPARDRSDAEQRILFRGKRIGRDYAELLSFNHNNALDHKRFIRARNRAEEKGGGYYGAGKVWAEKKVVWQLGVGHMDIWLPQTATAVEVLSSKHASPEILHSKRLQLVGYMEHDPEAANGVVVILDPSDLSEDRQLVSKHDPQYAELVEEMRDRIRQVQAWDAGEPMPARVCGKPSDARGHFCQYADHCFQDWEPPELPVVLTDEVVRLARQLYEVAQVKSVLSGSKVDAVPVQAALAADDIDAAISVLRDARTMKGAELLEKEIKARLTEAIGHAPEDFLQDPGEYQVGPLVLKRNVVDRAGYTVQPASYETLSVKRTSGEPLLPEIDFGDVPY
jgi:hypothetical protein